MGPTGPGKASATSVLHICCSRGFLLLFVLTLAFLLAPLFTLSPSGPPLQSTFILKASCSSLSSGCGWVRGSGDWASIGEMGTRQGGPFLSKGREDVTGISNSNSICSLSCHMESVFKDFISLRGRGYQAEPVPDIVRALDSHTRTGSGDSLSGPTLLPLGPIRQL